MPAAVENFWGVGGGKGAVDAFTDHTTVPTSGTGEAATEAEHHDIFVFFLYYIIFVWSIFTWYGWYHTIPYTYLCRGARGYLSLCVFT